MNSRLEALINRGYSRDVVENIAVFTEQELAYASECAFKHISRNCTPVNNPNAIFIGGQPGCGKTIMSMNLKNEIRNAIEIGIDNYRMYHPRYLEIEKVIRNFWKDKKETVNDTPGNDIADFTHFFAGAMTDKLIEMGKDKSYNLLLEWGMREPKGPLNTMKQLKENGYTNIVLFVSTHKDLSYQACNLRSEVMKNSKHIIRRVPQSFHDLCINTLPESINEIYENGYKKNLINYMALVTRNNKIIWDIKHSKLPGEVYKNVLNNDNYIKNQDNNYFMALKTSSKEIEKLNIDELKELKEEYVLIDFRELDQIKKK